MTPQAPPGERDRLLRDLLDALGGASRISQVASYARDAVLEYSGEAGAAARAGMRRDVPDTPFLAALRARLREGAGRETTFRAAPGRLRVEARRVGSDGAPPLLALAGPGARHDARPGPHGPEGPADCPACAGAALLREAAYEPRNLLAHAAERGAVPATASDGAIEIALPAEGLVYRFDRATCLCARRIDPRRGIAIHYGGWRRVGGIATPFLEIDETPEGVFERRVLAVAYDLPLAPIMM